MDDAAGLGLGDIVGRGAFGQVQHDQRLEVGTGWRGGADALVVAARLGGVDHRRHQIGHGNGASEAASRIRQHALEHLAVAQMQVPVIRAEQGQVIVHASSRC